MPIVAGTRLGPYEVVGALGAGGMGEVYRARDTSLDRFVALKLLPEALGADPDRLIRFQREARTLATLDHPHIARIHGLEIAGGLRAIVMELVEGEDLSNRLGRGSMPLDEALPVARRIAEALEAAHNAGIVHRDLKPANIKLRADGAVKVLDFGLAKLLPTIASPDVTQAGVPPGTAAYMAPEQARGGAVDKRADIWAFGCVLYEMLTGRRLFGGEDASETLAAVLRAEIDWHALPVATPDPVRRLLRRCLARDPEQRLPDIGVARLEFDDASAGAAPPPVARTTGRTRRPPDPASHLQLLGTPALTAPGRFGLRSPGPAACCRWPMRAWPSA